MDVFKGIFKIIFSLAAYWMNLPAPSHTTLHIDIYCHLASNTFPQCFECRTNEILTSIGKMSPDEWVADTCERRKCLGTSGRNWEPILQTSLPALPLSWAHRMFRFPGFTSFSLKVLKWTHVRTQGCQCLKNCGAWLWMNKVKPKGNDFSVSLIFLTF